MILTRTHAAHGVALLAHEAAMQRQAAALADMERALREQALPPVPAPTGGPQMGAFIRDRAEA